MYRSGDVIEGGTGRRKVESEWELLKAAADAFREAKPKTPRHRRRPDVCGTVASEGKDAELITEITTFASEHAEEISSETLTFWPHKFTSPLMCQFLRTLFLRHDQYAEWYSSVAFGYVARPGQ